MLKPGPSLWGKAAPILVHRLFGILCLTLASSGRPYWAFVDASRRRARLAVALVPFDGEDVEVGEASAERPPANSCLIRPPEAGVYDTAALGN